MFENKKVQKTVSKPEVDKAVRDFEKNQDCDVLLVFVIDFKFANVFLYFNRPCQTNQRRLSHRFRVVDFLNID